MTAWGDLPASREWGTGVRWADLDAFPWAAVARPEPDAVDVLDVERDLPA